MYSGGGYQRRFRQKECTLLPVTVHWANIRPPKKTIVHP
eukprot:COSAG06_NODE_49464_length_325_cov_0.814159_1_plen_38_part_10